MSTKQITPAYGFWLLSFMFASTAFSYCTWFIKNGVLVSPGQSIVIIILFSIALHMYIKYCSIVLCTLFCVVSYSTVIHVAQSPWLLTRVGYRLNVINVYSS